jgi:N-methylhydantoinase B
MAKTILWPRGPALEGHFRPLEVIAPEGTLFNPDSNAPTNLYGWPATVALEVMFKTLAPIFPDKVPACSGGDVAGNTYYGWLSKNQKFWWTSAIQGVGQGAKSFEDGADALAHFCVACSKNCPLEVEETQAPTFVERYELLQDSGGPGKHRGGLGYRIDYTFLEPGFVICMIERAKYPHWGQNGGKPGERNVVLVRTKNKSVEKYAIAKISEGYEILKCPSLALDKGDTVSERWGGGGGWGDPFEREIEAVRADVIDQYVNIESASRDYGVVIDPNTYEVDIEATKRVRLRPSKSGVTRGLMEGYT